MSFVVAAKPNPGHSWSEMDDTPLKVGTTNVGIGTTSPNPDVKLDVAGAIRSTTGPAIGIYFTDRTQQGTDFVWYADDNKARLWSNTGGVDIITLQTNGNVGIGTTTPFGKLDIYSVSSFDPTTLTSGHVAIGNGLASGWGVTGICINSAYGSKPVCFGASDGTWYWGKKTGAGTMSTTMMLNEYGDVSGIRNLNVLGNLNAWDINANVVNANALSAPVICLTGDTPPCRATWPTGGPGGDDGDWTIATDKIYTMFDHVGIGTSAPTEKLAVVGGNIATTGNLYVGTVPNCNGNWKVTTTNGWLACEVDQTGVAGTGSCRLLSGYGNTVTNNYFYSPNNICDQTGEFLTGGGGSCTNNYLKLSQPNINGGWTIQCSSSDQAWYYVKCCKFN